MRYSPPMHVAMGLWMVGILVARGLVVVIAIVAAAAMLGTVYQRHSEAAGLQRFKPQGQLVDIGGRRLHLLCAGAASAPTVVIEAGSGNDSTLWEDLLRAVSAFAHVCAYDRAGLGWSDEVSGASTIDDRAQDLSALLKAAALPGPFILVGHSYGGYIVRRFAALFPAYVAGVVLIDASEEAFAYAPAGLRDIEAIGWREWRLGWLIRLGVMRLAISLFPRHYDPVRGVPEAVRALMTTLFLRASRHFATADEMASYEKVPTSWRAAHGFGLLGDTPLAVVSRCVNSFPEWQAAQLRLTSLSTVSTHIVAEKSEHMIQFSQPGLIVGAIRHVLEQSAEAGRRQVNAK